MSRERESDHFNSRDGFLFVGNHLALDFVNTCPVQNGEPAELLPDFSALLRWFVAAELIAPKEAMDLEKRWGGSARAKRSVEALRELREELRKEIVSWEQDGPVRLSVAAELNRLMAERPMRTRLQVARREAAIESWFRVGEPEDLFAPLVQSAAMLFAHEDRTRVRKCGHCVLHFLDTSKKGTRRWCSMQLCGNRLKVAAYAARKRLGAG